MAQLWSFGSIVWTWWLSQRAFVAQLGLLWLRQGSMVSIRLGRWWLNQGVAVAQFICDIGSSVGFVLAQLGVGQQGQCIGINPGFESPQSFEKRQGIMPDKKNKNRNIIVTTYRNVTTSVYTFNKKF
jgi:hypothetical protein